MENYGARYFLKNNHITPLHVLNGLPISIRNYGYLNIQAVIAFSVYKRRFIRTKRNRVQPDMSAVNRPNDVWESWKMKLVLSNDTEI